MIGASYEGMTRGQIILTDRGIDHIEAFENVFTIAKTPKIIR